MGEETRALDLEELCRAVGVQSVRIVDPWELEETEVVIREEMEAPRTSVIISRRPCALRERRSGVIFRVEGEECNGCRRCLRLGCPALVMRGEKAVVQEDLCVGCSMCAQVGRPEALREVTGVV
jgi:indolepyruvate ferredoxin oxidoreductase alpha subunit